MRMSAKAEYAVRAMVQLATEEPGTLIKTDDLAKAQGIPPQFLVDILAELRARTDIRAVIWRGEGKSWSSGRDVGSIGVQKTDLSHHELMRRGHRGIQQLWDLDQPVLVAWALWSTGVPKR